jgi:2-keto-myo-inositol isomerase
VDSAIAFGNWIVDDSVERQAGLEQCKRDMQVIRAVGGRRIAAPPTGATKQAGLDLRAAGERYRALLEVGASVGVIPQLELWGFSQNVSTLAEVLFIAASAQHPDACILLDVYHMYKGGSDFLNVGLVPAQQMHCLHMNDYPAEPDRDAIGDADRVFPGDGIAPIDRILKTIVAGGFAGTLSLELFNREYWKRPADEIARTGIEKMRACVERALA